VRLDFEDLETPVGSAFLFEFVGFHNVALFLPQQSLSACNVFNVEVIGDPLESPFTFSVDEASTYYFGSSTLSSDNIPATCGLDVRLTVNVVSGEIAAQNTVGSSNHLQ
jgi:hypothetical protein